VAVDRRRGGIDRGCLEGAIGRDRGGPPPRPRPQQRADLSRSVVAEQRRQRRIRRGRERRDDDRGGLSPS
jgi:hypothetical protein